VKCPFCQEEIEPQETTSGNVVECKCPRCHGLVAAYQKGMDGVLKNLISMARFERSAK